MPDGSLLRFELHCKPNAGQPMVPNLKPAWRTTARALGGAGRRSRGGGAGGGGGPRTPWRKAGSKARRSCTGHEDGSRGAVEVIVAEQ
nr:unnamed protein product [Digitaria exilis]